MNPRDIILAAVRKNLPQTKVPLPPLSATNENGSATRTGYKQLLNILPGVKKLPSSGESLVPYFRRELEGMGGRSFEVADAAAAQAKIAELFPTAKVVCSAVPEIPGTSRVQDVTDPHTLNNVDVGVVRSPLGVAEAGAV
jgi:L-lactate dehydrogenase complex protein LldG